MSDNVVFLLILAVPVAGLYFLVLRPAQARARAAQQVSDAIEPGQRVMTASGLFGTVVEVTGDVVRLQISDGVVVEFTKRAISRVETESAPGPGGDNEG